MVFNTSQANYSLAFERTFSTVPRIGLGVYTMDFEYSPTFNVKVTDSTTTSNAILQVSTANAGKNNQLYLIYMATDHPYLGVFMPPSLSTLVLRYSNRSTKSAFPKKLTILHVQLQISDVNQQLGSQHQSISLSHRNQH